MSYFSRKYAVDYGIARRQLIPHRCSDSFATLKFECRTFEEQERQKLESDCEQFKLLFHKRVEWLDIPSIKTLVSVIYFRASITKAKCE